MRHNDLVMNYHTVLKKLTRNHPDWSKARLSQMACLIVTITNMRNS